MTMQLVFNGEFGFVLSEPNIISAINKILSAVLLISQEANSCFFQQNLMSSYLKSILERDFVFILAPGSVYRQKNEDL